MGDKLMVIFILFLVASGCGRAPGSYVGFEGFVDSFLAEGKARGVEVDMYGVDIRLVDTLDPSVSAGTIGVCDLDTGHITLLKSYWNEDAAGREELIFHELGHCALGKGHSSCPNVMCPVMMGGEEYASHRAYYLDVLFSK